MPDTRQRTEADQDALLLEIYALSRRFARETVRKQDVDDVAHEIAENCLIKLRAQCWYHDPSDLELFVRVLVWNHRIDRRRRRRVRARFDAEFLENRTHTPPAWVSTEGAGDEAAILALQDEILPRLPYECRIAYYMARREGLTYKQIAREFGVSPETIHNHIRHAHRVFRKELVRRGMDVTSSDLQARQRRAKWQPSDSRLHLRYLPPHLTRSIAPAARSVDERP
jgi:RNA polymerase sigma factor (sigma-70 family)